MLLELAIEQAENFQDCIKLLNVLNKVARKFRGGDFRSFKLVIIEKALPFAKTKKEFNSLYQRAKKLEDNLLCEEIKEKSLQCLSRSKK